MSVTNPPTTIDVPCTYCRQPAGQPCQPRDRWGTGPAVPRTQPHAVRVALAASGWAPRAHDGIPVVDIMTFIAANPGCTPKQIREHVGDDDASKVPSYLARLEAAHRIVKTGRGQYVVAGDADGEAAHE